MFPLASTPSPNPAPNLAQGQRHINLKWWGWVKGGTYLTAFGSVQCKTKWFQGNVAFFFCLSF